jgi:hypothetical protein
VAFQDDLQQVRVNGKLDWQKFESNNGSEEGRMSDHIENNSDMSMDEDSAAGVRAFEAVGKFMEEDGWHPQLLEDNYVYRAYFVGHNGEVTCFAQVRVDLEQFIFYVVMPVRAPSHMRLPVAEYLTRANYGLRIGNFEMDFDDGEVRYKSSLDFEGVQLTPGLIRNTIYPAVQTMDRYLPGILSVIFGGKSAEDAILAIEEDE